MTADELAELPSLNARLAELSRALREDDLTFASRADFWGQIRTITAQIQGFNRRSMAIPIPLRIW